MLPILLIALGCATPEPLPEERDPLDRGGSAGSGGNGGSRAGGAGSSAGGSISMAGSIGTSGSPGSSGSSGMSSAGAGGTITAGSAGKGGSAGAGGTSSAGKGGAAGAGGSSGKGGSGGSGGVPGNAVFFDDFEAGAGKWQTTTTGDWSLVDDAGNQVYQQGKASNTLRIAAAGDVAWTDQVVEARVKAISITSGSTSYLVGVYSRFQDIDNHYYLAIRADGSVVIRARKDGSNTSLGSSASVDFTAGTWHTVRIEAVGSSIRAFVNGTLVSMVTDSDIPAGGVAIGTNNATAQFDDVRVSVP